MNDKSAESLAYLVGVIALIEAVFGAVRGGKTHWKDTISNLVIWLLNNFIRAVIGNVLVLTTLDLAYRVAPRRIDMSIGSIVLLMLASDFLYYVVHYLRHRLRFLWAEHVVHHSSNHLNLSVAIRTPWLEVLSMALSLPLLTLVGFSPVAVLAAYKFVLLYQFFMHLDGTRKLPLIEGILTTPSSHRVHHGANPQYLDKNFGGILMIWDRMFGTYEPEGERPRYGLTTPLATANPLVINAHEWGAILRDVWRSRGARQALVQVFGRPAHSLAYAKPRRDRYGSMQRQQRSRAA